MQNISGPRRFGFAAIVIYRTFFVVHLQNTAGPRRLDIAVIVISATFFVRLIPQTLHETGCPSSKSAISQRAW